MGSTLPLNFYLVAVLPRVQQERTPGGMLLYQFGFLIATLGFFTIASAKRDDYILTALPSFAMAIAAPFAEDDNSSARLANGASFAAALSLLMLAVFGFIASRYPGILRGISTSLNSNDDSIYASFLLTGVKGHPVRSGLTMLVVAGASAIALCFALRRSSHTAALCVALAELAALSLWMGLLMPEFARSRTLRAFVLDARTIVGNHEVMIAGGRNYEVSYYLGRGVPAVPKHLALGGMPPEATYLFVWSQQCEGLRADENLFQKSLVLVSHATSGRRRMLLLSLDGKLPIETAR
jgi:hypothetical protein